MFIGIPHFRLSNVENFCNLINFVVLYSNVIVLGLVLILSAMTFESFFHPWFLKNGLVLLMEFP